MCEITKTQEALTPTSWMHQCVGMVAGGYRIESCLIESQPRWLLGDGFGKEHGKMIALPDGIYCPFCGHELRSPAPTPPQDTANIDV